MISNLSTDKQKRQNVGGDIDRVLVHQSMDPVACVRHAAVLQCGKSNGEQRGTAAAT